MIKIRLKRGGCKKRPFYRVVVTDNRNSRDGRFIENIGFFNPFISSQSERIHFNVSRLRYWISQGAQLSDRVLSLVKSNNFLVNSQ
ncbi:30S ribosomal protein S16 [Candidatus Schneideria nysicola]|nr:30S ribosomal protein S16 [Candidatus Schneideria nysicola]UAJ65784.1 30S ribosomal protein S16 [Candidatus Schneideria nysicola]UAJ66310.1 30S ribosomal protein S16 [Candidatus Schneideria nysicola]